MFGYPADRNLSSSCFLAQTVPGKVVLLAAFGLELWFFAAYPTVMQLLLPLALITFMPIPPIRVGSGASLPCAVQGNRRCLSV